MFCRRAAENKGSESKTLEASASCLPGGTTGGHLGQSFWIGDGRWVLLPLAAIEGDNRSQRKRRSGGDVKCGLGDRRHQERKKS